MPFKYKDILPFLSPVSNKLTRIMAAAGLGIGCILLLCSIQMFININELVKPKEQKQNGFDFISVTKNITNTNMGKDNSFSADNIKELNNQSFIAEAAPLISNQFRVKASAGEMLPFSTDLFLESIDPKFLDSLPSSFTWQAGQQDVPIIFSADFLELYNVFAPAQDLPQLSEATMQLVNIKLDCYGRTGTKLSFTGHIVGLSNRINSVLVPVNFMEWANKQMGDQFTFKPSRIYLKTKDANNPKLLNFLDAKGYRVNKDLTKFGRIKGALQSIIAGLSGFAIMVILLAMLVFSFYIQLIIARSQQNLKLLIELGFSPNLLSAVMTRKWLPAFGYTILAALLITEVVQVLFYKSLSLASGQLSFLLSPWVLVAAGFLFLICWYTTRKLVSNLLQKF